MVLVAVLSSGLTARTVLSTSFLFLVGGALVSNGFLGLIHITPDSEILSVTTGLALFALLFTDGQHVSFTKLRANWRNPARALGLRMPLAFVFMALVTHYLVGLDWTTSFLVGAMPAPINDDEASNGKIALELAPGLVFGILLPLATAITLSGLCHLTHANPYLAAFSAGAVLAATAPEAKEAFEPLGEALAELAKFAALLVFGALLTPHLFADPSWGGYVAVVLAIVLIRPVSLLIFLIGTQFDRREKLTAALFGPKGFASVVYGLLVLQSGIPHAREAYTLIAVCIAFSIVAHSSTDVPIARMFDVEDLVGIPDDENDGNAPPATGMATVTNPRKHVIGGT
ncbi:cation:proton antiporter [Streptomyces sp. NPDC005492]|uniref:cation:proton antiporter domain-containing protein n=1 Tax=Streptomyces sp. NPDC005492 TaxID=3156883 RepID=UPI0033A2EDE2